MEQKLYQRQCDFRVSMDPWRCQISLPQGCRRQLVINTLNMFATIIHKTRFSFESLLECDSSSVTEGFR